MAAAMEAPDAAHELAALRAAGMCVGDPPAQPTAAAAAAAADGPRAPRRARRRSGMHHLLVDQHIKMLVDPCCLEPCGIVGEGGWATVERAW